MKRRIWTLVVGLAARRRAHRGTGRDGRVHVAEARGDADGDRASSSRRRSTPNDDPTARVAINAPAGTQLTTTQAPGTVLGPVRAIVKALDLAGADLPLEGPARRRGTGAGSGGHAGRVHRLDRAARDLGDGADGGRADAERADLSPPAAATGCSGRRSS